MSPRPGMAGVAAARTGRVSQRGSALVIFTALLPVAVAAIGVGVDLGLAVLAQHRLQHAADAAALAGIAGREVRTVSAGGEGVWVAILEPRTAVARARAIFAENAGPRSGPPEVIVSPEALTVTVLARSRVRLAFTPMVGAPAEFRLAATATAAVVPGTWRVKLAL